MDINRIMTIVESEVRKYFSQIFLEEAFMKAKILALLGLSASVFFSANLFLPGIDTKEPCF